MTFNLPFTVSELSTPWLVADSKFIAPIVVSRTFRYRCPNGDAVWKKLANELSLTENGVFLGAEHEWDDFVKVTGCNIKYHKVGDFLEMANIINAAEVFMGNQNFAFSLAAGLCQASVLETIKIKPLNNNECYFPRTNIQYF